MTSLILATATRFMMPLLLLFSVFLLVRGHNEPGGGFAGGLVAAASFSLYFLAYGVEDTRKILGVDPRSLIGIGLLIALASSLLPLATGEPYMKGLWGKLLLPILGEVDLGTPLFFDVGVYLVVTGVTLTIILTLAEE